MEFIWFIGLFLLVTFFIPWVNFFRFGSVRDDIRQLRNRVRYLEDRLNAKESGSPKYSQPLSSRPEGVQDAVAQSEAEQEAQLGPEVAPYEVSARTMMEHGIIQVRANELEEAEEVVKETAASDIGIDVQPADDPYVFSFDAVKGVKSSFEQNIATKLPVWIGSISLIFAAYFLVKYSIEFGWFGPLARVSLGGLFGAGLLAAGQFTLKKPNLPNAERISQGLIGAGLVTLYVSLYAAINLYGLMSPILGFIGMSAVTALAVILSLRHGQPIAVFGLIGGLLTPALIASDAPNAVVLFSYLFLLFSGLFVVLIRKGWWALAIVALLGVFGWSAFWFMLVFAASDALALVMFATGLAVVVLAATGKRVADNTLEGHEEYSVHLLNAAAIAGGALTIIWLSFKVTLGLFDWSMLGLLSLALMTLAYFKPAIYQSPFLMKLGASLVLFFFWAQEVPLGDALAVIIGMSAIYVAGSALLMRRVIDPRFWAGVQASTMMALYLISYWVLDLPTWLVHENGGFGGMFWGILSLMLASVSIYQAADIRANYKADSDIQSHLIAVFALAGSAFISLGLAIELPWAYLPLAIAGQVAATAWVYQRTEIAFLKSIMYALTLAFVAMNYEQALLFGSIVTHSLLGEAPSMRAIGSYVLDAPLVKLGVPALLMYLSLSIVMRVNQGANYLADQKLIHALFGTANILILFTAYYMFRDVFHSGAGHIFSSDIGFIERGIITIALAGVGIGIFEFIRKYDVSFLKPWGAVIFRMAIFRFVYFDFFLHNPYWSKEQFVGNVPIFNGVTLTYGFGLLAVVWAMRSGLIAKTDAMRKLYGVIAIASVFALTSLNLRQYFHGGFLAQGTMSAAELYAYSAVWLLTGLAFLSAGIKFDNKAARMTSVAFIALAVFKVFLFDAAELEGLYRVFSFLGLGVSLIGLSAFYTRFVFNADVRRGEDNE